MFLVMTILSLPLFAASGQYYFQFHDYDFFYNLMGQGISLGDYGGADVYVDKNVNIFQG
jgi:hypothetical protein